MKFTAMVLGLAGLWLACSHDFPTQGPESTKHGDLVVDRLEVAMIYDDTPGFLYPRMRHEINFTGHLTVPGFIDHYFYKSAEVEYGLVVDYIANFSAPAGKPFQHHSQRWSAGLRQPGERREFEFEAASPFAKPAKVKGASVIQRRNDGVRPELNSRQLTGPMAYHGQPVFSRDGQWIYCRGDQNRSDGHLQTIVRVPAHGGAPEILVETTEFLGGFALTENDTKLTFVIWKPKVKSKLICHNLTSGARDTITVDNFIWGAALAPIPDTPLFISLSDPNSASDHGADLVLINAERRTVETLVEAMPYSQVQHWGVRPGTREISYGVSVGSYAVNVLLVNLDTRQTTTFLNHLETIDFAWAPNGQDYVMTKYLPERGTNIFVNESGVERRVTTYPGSDENPRFSPDARSLTFASRRRDEYQVWRIER